MTENELMLMSILGCRRVDLTVNQRKLTPAQKSRYHRMRTRRAQGEPLQYVIGQWDFMGSTLLVDRRALIPRPETEILVELASEKIRSMPKRTMFETLDLGAGSGNITIALLKDFPEMAMTAVDVSADALTLAAENAKANGVDQRVGFVRDDIASYLQEAAALKKKFGAVISNPPYIPTEQLARLPEDVRCEPRLALDGGKDGLRFYRVIIEYAWQILDAEGVLAMEIGDGQRDGIEMIFTQYPHYREIKFYKDYAKTDRIVIARPSTE